MKITLLGAGAWGTALAIAFAARHDFRPGNDAAGLRSGANRANGTDPGLDQTPKKK